MPLLPLKDDKDTLIYYEHFNTFDTHKETLLFLPGFLSDLSFCATQYNHPSLRARFNLMGIEPRCFGRSKAHETPELDLCVQAAEVAFVLDALNMPAVHLFAPQSQACTIAKRFAYLFPERILSMVFAGLTDLYEGAEHNAVYCQLLEAWLGDDPLDFNEATIEVLDILFNQQAATDMTLYAHNLAAKISEDQASFYLNAMAALHRKDITRDALALIQCPVLLIQGTKDGTTQCADWYKRQISKAQISIYACWNAPHAVSITHSNIVNRVILQFLSQQPQQHEKGLRPMKTSFSAALERLPHMVNNASSVSVQNRPSADPLAFSLATFAEVTERQEKLESLKRRLSPNASVLKYGAGGLLYDRDESKIINKFFERHA